jgi:hypothetical protein
MAEHLFLKEYIIQMLFSIAMVIFAISAIVNPDERVIPAAVKYTGLTIPAIALLMAAGMLIS